MYTYFVLHVKLCTNSSFSLLTIALNSPSLSLCFLISLPSSLFFFLRIPPYFQTSFKILFSRKIQHFELVPNPSTYLKLGLSYPFTHTYPTSYSPFHEPHNPLSPPHFSSPPSYLPSPTFSLSAYERGRLRRRRRRRRSSPFG